MNEVSNGGSKVSKQDVHCRPARRLIFDAGLLRAIETDHLKSVDQNANKWTKQSRTVAPLGHTASVTGSVQL